jgi:chromosome segregation ATPase
MSGCTLAEKFRRDEQPVSAEVVSQRKEQLASLEQQAAQGAPVALGEARATLSEMEYFAAEGRSTEVARLDARFEELVPALRTPPPVKEDRALADLTTQRDDLAGKVRELEDKVRRLEKNYRGLQVSSESDIRNMTARLESVRAARDEAIREVVRTRARIQGLASKAEAAAMFAEARVFVDRMEEDAYSTTARESLDLARSYLHSGKKELDNGNPGGAAYLFDLVSAQYQSFGEVDTRTFALPGSGVVLRREPITSSAAIKKLSRGTRLKGIKRQGNWIQVQIPDGRQGWIPYDDAF